MCGRYVLKITIHELEQQFRVHPAQMLLPRFNIAPTQDVPIIRAAQRAGNVPRNNLQSGTAASPARELAMVRWGLIPSWSKEPSSSSPLINARAETVAEKPAFRTALKRRRCLVPANGFYEWEKVGGQKQPYFIHLTNNQPLAFAGLWETWYSKPVDGESSSVSSEKDQPSPLAPQTIESCTIITTEANSLMRDFHDRMPVILAPNDYDAWLDPQLDQAADIEYLLAPYPAEEMTYYPVSTHVNNARHEDPQCLVREQRLF